MNLVDVFIVEIIEEPKQIISNDLCRWQVKVMTDCYGCKKEKIFRGVSKDDVSKYVVGYKWME